MPVIESEVEAVRRQLQKVLQSPGFARNERLSQFLLFVVDRHLEGRDHELKESVIGVEVFGRKPDFNPKQDPIVRTEARRLRARLSGYYDGEGATDAMLIDLPKGGYVPMIRQNPTRIAGAKSDPAGRLPLHWLAVALGCLAVGLTAAGWARFEQNQKVIPVVVRSKANAEAYALYLRARGFQRMPELRGTEDSIDLFEQAITKDPSFAPAYAGVGAGHAARSGFDRFDAVERADMMNKGWAAARRAIELDPRLPDAYDALGMMQSREAQWEQAERSFRVAIELASGDPLWHDHFAMFLLLPLGRIEEALRQLRSAEELDPLSPETHYVLSLALRAAGRFDEAEAHCRKIAENDRQNSSCWAQTLLRQGNAEQAVKILETVWSSRLLQSGAAKLGVAYASAGRRQDAERVAAFLPRPFEKAQIFAALGDKDRTFAMLDQMVPMGPIRIGRDVLISPDFAFLRGDPRLQALRRKVGLPE